MSEVRVRFAPSPTGALHLGSALTAVANFLFGRRAGGTIILRVDDTDPKRSERRYERSIRQDAEWLGLRFDEGPDEGGPFGPYRQSERVPLYVEHARRLVASGHAHVLETADEVGRTGAIAFRTPTREVVIQDVVRGQVRVPAGALEDFVLVRSDGSPTYTLATAVDDALMQITHVIRGGDHVTNTAKQLLVLEALGLRPPRYAHMTLLVGEDGQKLSKRAGAPSIAELRSEGYPPEALFNYFAQLACPAVGDDPLLPGPLGQRFELASMSRGESRFDRGRLDWLSQQHLKRLNSLELARRVGQVLEVRHVVPVHPSQMLAIAPGLVGCHTLLEAADEAEAVMTPPRATVHDEAGAAVAAHFARVRAGWPADFLGPEDADEALDELRALGAAEGLSRGTVQRALRRVLTGRERGIGLRYVVAAVHRDDAIARAQRYLTAA